MTLMDAVTLSGAFAVPLVAVAALFYGMTNSSLRPLRDDVKALRDEVHALDVRLARVEVKLESAD